MLLRPFARGEGGLAYPLPTLALRSEGEAMTLQVKALVPFVTGIMIAAAAQAQLLPTWETHITLTQQDLDRIRDAVTNQVHGKPIGTTASWNNPASGNSGSIRLVKKLTRKNQQCEGSNIQCAQRARPFTPNTTTSPAASNRTARGRSPEPSCLGKFAYGPGTDRRNSLHPQ
jgi:surface antigen